MTKKTKVVLILTHVLVLAVGFGAGVLSSVARTLREGSLMMSQATIISHYAALVDVQRNEGVPDAYRKALLAFLNALDDISKTPSKFFDEKTISTDKMLTYERLSRLERADGNLKATDEYLKLATDTCSKTGWKDCSIEKIQKISKRMEESSLAGPKDDKGNATKH